LTCPTEHLGPIGQFYGGVLHQAQPFITFWSHSQSWAVQGCARRSSVSTLSFSALGGSFCTLRGLSTVLFSPLHRSFSPFSVHYENNYPFAVFNVAVREIEVSHWGNVAFEDYYEVQHSGASLKGGFSRYDYMVRSTQERSLYCITCGFGEVIWNGPMVTYVITPHRHVVVQAPAPSVPSKLSSRPRQLGSTTVIKSAISPPLPYSLAHNRLT